MILYVVINQNPRQFVDSVPNLQTYTYTGSSHKNFPLLYMIQKVNMYELTKELTSRLTHSSGSQLQADPMYVMFERGACLQLHL